MSIAIGKRYKLFQASTFLCAWEKSLNKKSPRETRGIASDTEFPIFHIILNIFSSFCGLIGLIRNICHKINVFHWQWKFLWKFSPTLPNLISRKLYVQWKANVKTFAKVKNWALLFQYEAERSGNEGKLEDYVLGFENFFFSAAVCCELQFRFFSSLRDYVRLILAGNDGALLLMLFSSKAFFVVF